MSLCSPASEVLSNVSLNGEWRLTSPQRPEISVPMTLPGDNVSALLAAGVIVDPYWEIMKSRSNGLQRLIGILNAPFGLMTLCWPRRRFG